MTDRRFPVDHKILSRHTANKENIVLDGRPACEPEPGRDCRATVRVTRVLPFFALAKRGRWWRETTPVAPLRPLRIQAGSSSGRLTAAPREPGTPPRHNLGGADIASYVCGTPSHRTALMGSHT